MSQIIIDIGDAPDDGLGTPLRQAFADINQMFSEVYTAGPVDSNVRIANNTITTTVINSNLILSPSGIGKVQLNNSIFPRVDNVYDLGSPTQRFNSLYIGTGGFDIAGNLTIGGNISAQYFIGNGALLTGIDTSKIANGNSTVQVYENGNVTFSIAGTSNVVTVSNTGVEILGNLTVDGNVTYINITNLNVKDPIIGLGRGANNAPLTTNDGLDRGTQLWYYDSQEKSAFFGFDNSSGNIFAAVDVTVANEIVTVNQYGNFIVGNIVGETLSVSGNISAANFTGNVSGNITAPGANTEIIFNDNGLLAAEPGFTYDRTSNTVSVANTVSANNVVATTFYGDGSQLDNVLADRGAAPMNWNTATKIGVYTVNNTSWSGTTGAPLDSTVYVGMLEVKNSTNTAITQSFWPGVVDNSSNVKLMWARNYWNGTWTAWQKIVNDQQIIDGGSGF
jgi:hypothetical protein